MSLGISVGHCLDCGLKQKARSEYWALKCRGAKKASHTSRQHGCICFFLFQIVNMTANCLSFCRDFPPYNDELKPRIANSFPCWFWSGYFITAAEIKLEQLACVGFGGCDWFRIGSLSLTSKQHRRGSYSVCFCSSQFHPVGHHVWRWAMTKWVFTWGTQGDVCIQQGSFETKTKLPKG